VTRYFIISGFNLDLQYAIKKVQPRQPLRTKFRWDILVSGQAENILLLALRPNSVYGLFTQEVSKSHKANYHSR
jgi:predicted lipid carrier protein YhbT